MKDTKFYDRESSAYSKKRYPLVDTDYLHFFFKKRLKILLSYLDFIPKGKGGMKLLEIGCADGVILRAISEHTESFSEMLGIDISPKMIEVAKSETSDKNISFSLRNYQEIGVFDVILEIGVLNFNDLEKELTFVKRHLKKEGYYICSIASGTSLRARLKSDGDDGSGHFLNFTDYDREFKKHFKILKSTNYGLFIPLLWKISIIAMIVQPIFDNLFELLSSRLLHEKIYLLSNK